MTTEVSLWMQALLDSIRDTEKELKVTKGLILRDELKARERVLRRLGFVDRDGVVTIKGRAMLKINSAEELVLAEIVFNGDLTDLSAPQITGVLSCFVCEEFGAKSKPNKVSGQQVPRPKARLVL